MGFWIKNIICTLVGINNARLMFILRTEFYLTMGDFIFLFPIRNNSENIDLDGRK